MRSPEDRSSRALRGPHLIDLEVAQVLRRYSLSGDLEPLRGEQALQDDRGLPIERYPHDLFLDHIWEMRHNVTAHAFGVDDGDSHRFSAGSLYPSAGGSILASADKLAAAPGHEARLEVF